MADIGNVEVSRPLDGVVHARTDKLGNNLNNETTI